MLRKLLPLLRHGARLVLRKPVADVRVVPILPDGRIVLVRNRDNGRWSLPGGVMEWGNDVITTAAQELREETGAELTEVERLVGVYSAPERTAAAHFVYVVLAARVRGEPRARQPEEVREARAFTRDELPLDAFPDTQRRQLRDYLSGATVVA